MDAFHTQGVQILGWLVFTTGILSVCTSQSLELVWDIVRTAYVRFVHCELWKKNWACPDMRVSGTNQHAELWAFSSSKSRSKGSL